MKKNLMIVASGVLLSILVGCGQPYMAPPADPIANGRSNGLLPDANPQTNANVGPIDGTWNRTTDNTTCTQIGTSTSIAPVSTYTGFSFYIDNQSGFILLNYQSGLEVSIPVSYTYSSANQFTVSRGMGAVICKALPGASGNCIGYQEPTFGMTVTYTNLSPSTAKFAIDRDPICRSKGASTSNVTLSL